MRELALPTDWSQNEEYLLFSWRLTSSAKSPTKHVICIKKLMTTARPALRAKVFTAGTVREWLKLNLRLR